MQLTEFANTVSQSQRFWVLCNKQGDFAMLESQRFVNLDVLPVWENKTAAAAACQHEWRDFSAKALPLAQWYSTYLPQLTAIDALVCIDDSEQPRVELELNDFTHHIVQAILTRG